VPLLCLAVACGDPPARVQLVPIDLGTTCGKPDASQVSAVRVIAYRPGPEQRRTDQEISDFPADTEQLGAEVLGGQVVLATGKTVPLAYGELADKTQIAIAMVPPNGFCPVRPMTTPRAQPLLARAGAGVLVIGGEPISSSVEYYDPATATFTTVALPGDVADPTFVLRAAAATLADGRVVITSGQALTVFDPQTMKFSSPSFVSNRVEHAALGIDANHVLLTGGCLPASATCDATSTALHSSIEYEIDASGKIVGDGRAKAPLTAASTRYHSRIFDVGVVSDGKRRFVLAGGTFDPTTSDRIPFDEEDDSGTTTLVQTTHAQVALLDGGGILTAFDPDGTVPQTGAASIIPPESGNAVPVALAPPFDGARLVGVEDGTVFAIGGDPQIARYNPTTNSWTTLTPAGDGPGGVTAPSLINLDDGTVLVVGGSPATPSVNAWLFRPSLVGPRSGQVVAFGDGTGAILTTPTQATATRTAGHLTLMAPGDDLSARALVGGPRITTGTMNASIHVAMGLGGVALIAQQTAPGRMLVARLVAGEAARIERHVGSVTTTLCAGSLVTADELDLPLQLAITADSVAVTAGGITKVSCDFANDPIAAERGAWGIAATAGAAVDVATVTVAR
jgi:hypothetical protein